MKAGLAGVDRRHLLAALAGLGLLAVAADALWIRRGADPAAPAAAPAGGRAAALPPGAPPELDREALAARYAPLIAADPFAPRSFHPPPRPVERPAAPPPRPASGPPPVDLRFTGVVGQGAAQAGVFEARGTGSGLLASVGDRVGAAEVAAIRSDGLVLSEDGRQRVLALGEQLEVPAAQAPTLTPLHTATVAAPTGSAASGPPLSADARQSILERLRARRRASLEADAGGGE